MTRAIVVLLLFVTACTIPQTAETTEDSVTVLSEDTLAMASDEVSPADTIYNPLDLGNKFDKPQLDPNAGYVYNDEGLDVFETNAAANVVGHIDYKTKVKVLGNRNADYVAVEYNGKTAYVQGDYVLSLPVPGTSDLIEYFVNTLQLQKPVVERKSKPEAEDGSFLLVGYAFENGFKVFRHEYYEGGGTDVTLPGYTAGQAFVFASHFFEGLKKNFAAIPTDAVDKKFPDESYVKVDVLDGKVQSIVVGKGEGCYEQESVTVVPEGSMIITEGGC